MSAKRLLLVVRSKLVELLVNVESRFFGIVNRCKSWVFRVSKVGLVKWNSLVSLLNRWAVKGRAIIKRVGY